MFYIILFVLLNPCNGFTPIRQLISSQAFTASLTNMVNRELINDSVATNLYNDIFTHHYHVEKDLFYISILIATMYIEYNNCHENFYKWNKIMLFQNQNKIIKSFITFMFFMFIRNVETAR